MTEKSGAKRSRAWTKVSRLGAGSFATVWLGSSASDGKLFAVKTAEDGSRSAESLRREFEVLGSLACDQIVRCFGAESTVENGIAFYNVLMEYMERGSIAEILKRGPLSEKVIRSHIRSVLMGLRFIHDRGIVHGDVKGGNVLVGLDGFAKLGDFGCARRLGFAGEKNLICGTPLWSAPEVVLMLEQGTPSDIWSLGCTVIEMATGKNPWSGLIDENGGIGAALYSIGCSDDVPFVADGVLSEVGVDFLSKCLVRDPCKRWTAQQLLCHPFVSDGGFCDVAGNEFPLSPVSPFEFGSRKWDSEDDNGSLVSLPEISEKSLDFKEKVSRRLSAKERIQKLAAGDVGCGSGKVTEKLNLFERLSNSFGEWILVRGSPAISSPETSAEEPMASRSGMGVERKQVILDDCMTLSKGSVKTCCSSSFNISDYDSLEYLAFHVNNQGEKISHFFCLWSIVKCYMYREFFENIDFLVHLSNDKQFFVVIVAPKISVKQFFFVEILLKHQTHKENSSTLTSNL